MDQNAYTYVDEHLISPSLTCPICFNVLEEPHVHTPCDSAFCRSCLLQLAEPSCPICRWSWDPTVPLQYNIYFPKANRLIRNMLDDLLVECLRCHIVRRRGEFEHICEATTKQSTMGESAITTGEYSRNRHKTLHIIVVTLFVIFIYNYRMILFEKVIDSPHEIISDIGYNIDYFLLAKLYYFLRCFIEYSTMVLLTSVCFWFCIIYFAEHISTKFNSRILRTFLEISIIINLIIYSFVN